MKAVVKVDIVDGKCVVIYSDGSEQELYDVSDDTGGGGEAVLGTKNITSNGSYTARSDGYDGYSKVNVNVPTGSAVLGTKHITSNGIYDASSDNLDGYSSVSVAVTQPAPILKRIDVTENGVYKSSDYNAYGFEQVTVNVPSSGDNNYAFIAENGYFGSAKWLITDCLQQMFNTGYCELILDTTGYTYQAESGIKVFSFGGNISTWAPSSNDHILFNVYSIGNLNVIFRGSSASGTITIRPNASNIFHLKLYKDKLVVLDGSTISNADSDTIQLTSGALTVMTNVLNLSAISIGCNEGNNANNYYKGRVNKIAFHR